MESLAEPLLEMEWAVETTPSLVKLKLNLNDLYLNKF
jgi:hypothetical protein